MAIKDQCTQCCHYNSGMCNVSGLTPDFNYNSCESYKKSGINLEKCEGVENENSPTHSEENIHVEKQSMFAHPFSFHGRIRRTEYGLSIIILYVYAFVVGLLVGGVAGGNEGIMYLFLIPGYWFIWAQNAKRCHDRDNSGWYQIIPFYGLWMLFGDGDAYENHYGPDPKGRNMFA